MQLVSDQELLRFGFFFRLTLKWKEKLACANVTKRIKNVLQHFGSLSEN